MSTELGYPLNQPIPDSGSLAHLRSQLTPSKSNLTAPIWFLLANVVLGVAMAQSRMVALFHVVAVSALVLWALFIAPKLEHLVYVAGYVTCVDVLWRMTKAPAPWEVAKYMLIALMGGILVRFVRHPRRVVAPLIYLLMLLPAVMPSLLEYPPGWTREQISFVLMGPVVLGLGVIVFRQLILTRDEMITMLWYVVGTIVAISMVVLIRLIEADAINFRNQSNAAAAGGFGPNQVSVVFGFGALACVMLFLEDLHLRTRVFALLLGLGFVAQALLSFSRGGIYSAVIALAAIAVTSLITSGTRSRMVKMIVLGVLGVVMIFGWLDGFTDGQLGLRMANHSTTNRGDIAAADLDLFKSNPVFGVGIGGSNTQRVWANGRDSDSHTELTRMLAEHGVFGLVAIAAMLVMFFNAVRSANPGWNRLMAVGFGTWALVTTSHASMRIGLIPFVFAMATLRVVSVQRSPTRVIQDQVVPAGALRPPDRVA